MNRYGNSMVKVWDPLVRIFHWSLVLFFAVSFLSGEDAEGLHVFSGYVIVALIVFRVFWGFIGTKHARFADFVCGPGEIKEYMSGFIKGRPRHYLGHNPAGGAMVILLLISLSITCYTGLAAYGAEGHGPFADGTPGIVSVAHANGDEGERGKGGKEDELWEEVHEVFSGITLFLVGVHIAGAVVASLVHRENLILAMITGRKPRG